MVFLVSVIWLSISQIEPAVFIIVGSHPRETVMYSLDIVGAKC